MERRLAWDTIEPMVRRGWLALTLLAASCGSESSATEVIIAVDAEPSVRAAGVTVRIEVLNTSGVPVDFIDARGAHSARFERSLVEGELDAVAFPVRVRAVPGDGDATRGFEVVAEALDDTGAVISMKRVPGAYVDGRSIELRILLEPLTMCDGAAGPRCSAGVLTTCTDGVELTEPCVLGCSDSGTACRELLPSNVAGLLTLDLGTGNFSNADETWVVDTDTGEITAYAAAPGGPTGDPVREVRAAGFGADGNGIVFTHVDPGPGTPTRLAVLSVGTFTVGNGATVIGHGSLPLVLVAATDVDIAGRLSVAANELPDALGPGPGGFAGGTPGEVAGEGPGAGSAGGVSNPTWNDAGGGGGGFGSSGGAGGPTFLDADPSFAGGDGGGSYGNVLLVPLQGGSGGGAGAPDYADPRPAGGNGGGAIQLVAGRSITVRSTGFIDASGSGGRSDEMISGGGGGSGGAILIEAPVVTIEPGGAIGANGGAGAGGSIVDGRGEDGRADSAPAMGSVGGGEGGGGDGSDQDGAAMNGILGQDGGGGGGGAGRIRINDASGTTDFAGARVLPRLGSCCAQQGTVARTP